jgi:hypothetical protein
MPERLSLFLEMPFFEFFSRFLVLNQRYCKKKKLTPIRITDWWQREQLHLYVIEKIGKKRKEEQLLV